MSNVAYREATGAEAHVGFRLETPLGMPDACLARGTKFDPDDIERIDYSGRRGTYASYCHAHLTDEGHQKIGGKTTYLGMKTFDNRDDGYEKYDRWRAARGEFDKLNELGGAKGYLPKAHAFGTYFNDIEEYPAIVMEHIAGERLSDERETAGKAGCVSPKGILRSICKVAWAISCMHDTHCTKGAVAHRDLSPKNFLVECQTEGGWLIKNIAIVDLGQAKNSNSNSPTPDMGRPGTIRYCAPEVDVAREHSRDQRLSQHPLVDLWSLGALAVFLWTGVEPKFKSDDEAKLPDEVRDARIKEEKRKADFHLQLVDQNGESPNELQNKLSKLIAQWTDPNPDKRVADSSYRDTPMKDALRDLKKLCNQFNVEWDPKSDREIELEKEHHEEIPNETPSMLASDSVTPDMSAPGQTPTVKPDVVYIDADQFDTEADDGIFDRPRAGYSDINDEADDGIFDRPRGGDSDINDVDPIVYAGDHDFGSRQENHETAPIKPAESGDAEVSRAREEAAAKAAVKHLDEERKKTAEKRRRSEAEREEAAKAKAEEVRRKKEKRANFLAVAGVTVAVSLALSGIIFLAGALLGSSDESAQSSVTEDATDSYVEQADTATEPIIKYYNDNFATGAIRHETDDFVAAVKAVSVTGADDKVYLEVSVRNLTSEPINLDALEWNFPVGLEYVEGSYNSEHVAVEGASEEVQAQAELTVDVGTPITIQPETRVVQSLIVRGDSLAQGGSYTADVTFQIGNESYSLRPLIDPIETLK